MPVNFKIPSWPYHVNANLANDMGLVAWYPSYTGSSNKLFDVSQYGNHGAIESDVQHTTDPSGQPALAYINQYGSFASTSKNNFAYNEDFTVSLWFLSFANTGEDTVILDKWDNNLSIGYPLVIRTRDVGGNAKLLVARYDGTNNPFIIGSKSIADGNLYHIVFRKLGSSLTIYVNTILDGSTTDDTTGDTTNSTEYTIAYRPGGGNYTLGGINNIAMFNKGLSLHDIDRLYRDPYCLAKYDKSKIHRLSSSIFGLADFDASIEDVHKLVYYGDGGIHNSVYVEPEPIPLPVHILLKRKLHRRPIYRR